MEMNQADQQIMWQFSWSKKHFKHKLKSVRWKNLESSLSKIVSLSAENYQKRVLGKAEGIGHTFRFCFKAFLPSPSIWACAGHILLLHLYVLCPLLTLLLASEKGNGRHRTLEREQECGLRVIFIMYYEPWTASRIAGHPSSGQLHLLERWQAICQEGTHCLGTLSM